MKFKDFVLFLGLVLNFYVLPVPTYAADCDSSSKSSKELVSLFPVIFEGREVKSSFEVLKAYKGLPEEGEAISLGSASQLVSGKNYIIFADSNDEGKLALDECGLTFDKVSVSESKRNAELLAELEVFRAQVNALNASQKKFPQDRGGSRSWATEVGKVLQEYGDYERALKVYKQAIIYRHNLVYNKETEQMEQRSPPEDPFTMFEDKSNHRGPYPRFDGMRDELKEYASILYKLGRYDEAITPLEMAIKSGKGAPTHQLFFEAVLKSRGKEYFDGKRVRLEQIQGKPNYEVSGVDLSNIKINFNHTSDTTFNDVDFSNSDLTGAKFREVIFKGVNFTGARLGNVEFTDCEYDDDTEWPEGFNPLERGLVQYSEKTQRD